MADQPLFLSDSTRVYSQSPFVYNFSLFYTDRKDQDMAQSSLKILSENQIGEIDKAVMQLLSRVGLDVASGKVRAILVDAGCSGDDSRVRFPEKLVRDTVFRAPQAFTLEGRVPEYRVQIGDGRTHIQPMVGRLNILDFEGARRRTNLEDVAHIVAVCDAIQTYDILHGGAVMPQIGGVPPGLTHVAGFVQTLRHTGKPFKGSCRGARVAEDCIRLAEITAEKLGKPFTLHTTCNLISPLQIAADMSEGALYYIEKGWPVDFASEPQMGATSPVTLAGTAVQTMAECLAGVVLAQAVNPGSPVFAGTVGAAMDMRHTTIALGGVESALLNAAHAQMAEFYRLPSRGTGSNTNSKQLDFQAGYEKMLTLLIPVMAGIDMLFYPGTIEHAETISLESLVLDGSLCDIALKAQQGIRVTEDLLSVDLVEQVGPGGTFLTLPQTAREMFNEHLVRGMWDRRRRSDWESAGSPSPETRAHEEVIKILCAPPVSLPENLDRAIMDAAGEIASREGNSGLVKLLEQQNG